MSCSLLIDSGNSEISEKLDEEINNCQNEFLLKFS